MYNFNSFPNYGMSPYQQYNYQTAAQQLQQEQVTQVNGKASVEQLQLAPNSSKLVMDTTAPIVWLCVSDGVGRVTATPYDINEHRDAPPVDFTAIEQRLAAVEMNLQKMMEERVNDKPNVTSPATEQRSTYTSGKRDK